jgi:hypothetical protein
MKIGLFRSGRRRRSAGALLAAVGLGAASLVAGVPGSASAAATATTSATTSATVTVTYQINANWGYGFQAGLTITPTVAVTNGWTLEFDAGDQQTLTFAAYAAAVQSGRHVALSNRPFNGTIAAGATLNLVVQFANPTYSNVPPAGFVFNGQPAAYVPSPRIVVSDPKPAVPEGGSSAITVQLSQAPTANVVLELLGPSAPAVTASPGRLTFTPGNWNVPQTVTLGSPRDADTTNQTSTYQIEQRSGYPSLYPADVILATQIDNG